MPGPALPSKRGKRAPLRLEGLRGPLRGLHCLEPREPSWEGGEYEYLPGYLEC